jgi:hypothetical protein
MEVMEYSEDVKHFHAHGHAACEAYAMAVSLAADLLHRIKQVDSINPEFDFFLNEIVVVPKFIPTYVNKIDT